jgi:hypothetical protein
VEGSCEHGNEPSGSMNFQEIRGQSSDGWMASQNTQPYRVS